MIYLHIYESIKNAKVLSKQLLDKNLKEYLKTDEYVIEINENGKPRVGGIYFSVSHSKNVVVQAFSHEAELGIDTEYINQKRNYIQLAKRYFHANEYKRLKSLNGDIACKLFYSLWSAKEAVCKAQGGRLWYYLWENYLDKSNQLANSLHRLNIKSIKKIENYSLAISSYSKLNEIKFIYE